MKGKYTCRTIIVGAETKLLKRAVKFVWMDYKTYADITELRTDSVLHETSKFVRQINRDHGKHSEMLVRSADLKHSARNALSPDYDMRSRLKVTDSLAAL
jgi:hypothetical protein